ncbi:thymopoietin a isoform X2 [Festucalex cinctus]
MPEYMDDPSQLTKDKLKSELLAHNVELPSGNHNKDVYVQLYLENLTAHNKKHVAATATTFDAFSSDEELPPPVVSSRSRSSGKKAPRKTDKIRPDKLDVSALTDDYLRDELLKRGIDAGPIVASTRKVYEKKLQKLLDDDNAQATITKIVVTEIQVNHNGNSDSDLYSDKEDDVTAELEPVPVVERPVRSRGKTPVTTRTHSGQHKTLHHKRVETEDLLNTALLEVPEPRHAAIFEKSFTSLTPAVRRKSRPEEQSPLSAAKQSRPFSPREECGSPESGPQRERRQEKITSFLSKGSPVGKRSSTSSLFKDVAVTQVEKIAASDQTPKVAKNDVLKELFANDFDSPTGIMATCRRPIRGAAGRPVLSSDLWNVQNSPQFSPKTTKTISNSTSSSYTKSRLINRGNSFPNSSSSSIALSSTSASMLLSAPPPTGPNKVVRPGMSLWKKVIGLALAVAFVFLIYQAMESNDINPFAPVSSEEASGSKA